MLHGLHRAVVARRQDVEPVGQPRHLVVVTLPHYLRLRCSGEHHAASIDQGDLHRAELGLVGLAVGIASIGLACSAFASSQILAAAATVALAFGLYDFGWAHALVSEDVALALDAIALRPHFARFAEGIIALSDLLYFAGCAAVAATLARLSLELRRVTG